MIFEILEKFCAIVVSSVFGEFFRVYALHSRVGVYSVLDYYYMPPPWGKGIYWIVTTELYWIDIPPLVSFIHFCSTAIVKRKFSPELSCEFPYLATQSTKPLR